MSSVDESANSIKKRISGQALAGDIRAGMEASQILAKYGLSHDQLQRAMGKLVAAGLLNETVIHGVDNEDPDLTMTVNLMACPVCNHEQPDQSTECSKCGLVFSKIRTDTLPKVHPQSESPSRGYRYALIAGIGACLVLLFVVLGWMVASARKEARLAYEESIKQEESRKAAELQVEELQQREQTLLEREYDLKQAEYEGRVNSAVSGLSMTGQRWTEEFERKLAAYERTNKLAEARRDRLQSRQILEDKRRAAAHFRAYAMIVKDIQSLGVDYRTRSLSRSRVKQAAKSVQTKLFHLKTYPSASPVVVRRLETALHHLMIACRCTRYGEARSHLEAFWSDANAAMEIMSQEISSART